MNTGDLNVKKWMDSGAYEKQKEVIRKEINADPLVINYNVFRKTPQERAELATLRMQWKKQQSLNTNAYA